MPIILITLKISKPQRLVLNLVYKIFLKRSDKQAELSNLSKIEIIKQNINNPIKTKY